MKGNIELSSKTFKELYNKTINYFTNLELYPQLAWAAIGLGLILIITGTIML